MRKIKVNGIIFLISLISCLFLGGNTALAKENPNTIEFLSYDEEILILRSNGETVLISEGDNVEGIIEGINKENLKEIDLFVLRSMEEETDELIKTFINKSSVKKILLPTLNGVSEEVREEFKEEIAKLERNTSLRKKEFIRLFKIFITVGILTYFSVKFNITLLIAPPLIVAFIELTNEHCKFRQRSKSLLFLFIVVAILGFIFRIGFNEYLGMPLWLCTIFLLISLFICLEIFNMYFPPVAAIAVLPMLLTSKQVMFYPFQIAIGCFIFITIAMIFFREEKCIVDTFKN